MNRLPPICNGTIEMMSPISFTTSKLSDLKACLSNYYFLHVTPPTPPQYCIARDLYQRTRNHRGLRTRKRPKHAPAPTKHTRDTPEPSQWRDRFFRKLDIVTSGHDPDPQSCMTWTQACLMEWLQRLAHHGFASPNICICGGFNRCERKPPLACL